MYLVIFLIILILIILFRIYNMEKFQTCNFSLKDPSVLAGYGEDVNNCIMDCYNNPLYKDKCANEKTCQEICLNCKGYDDNEVEWNESTKKEMCPWYEIIREIDSKEPEAPIIRGYPGDSSIVIEWKRPYDNKSTITKYIVDINEVMSKKKSSKLIFVKNNECNVCEFKIKGLKNQVNHSINLRAVNARGIGPVSNTIEVVPNGVDTELLKNIDDDINGNLNSDNSYTNYECLEGYKFNDLSLDMINIDEIDIRKHINELDNIESLTTQVTN